MTTVHGERLLPSGHVMLFDEADRELVDQYRWFALAGTRTHYAYGYPIGGISYPRFLLHRLLLDPPKGFDVDHHNGNGLDNRRANLRIATRAQNNAARTRPNRVGPSGYKGVGKVSPGRKRWRAFISNGNKQQHLGVFDDPWDAAQAYNEAARALWGEFAVLNERRQP